MYLSTERHLVPLTGLNVFVYTDLTAQKLLVDGQLDGQKSPGDPGYSKSTYGANNGDDFDDMKLTKTMTTTVMMIGTAQPPLKRP